MDNDMITVQITGPLHFAVRAACGRGWSGMRHSDDVRIVLDRAMYHPKTCADCTEIRQTTRLVSEKVTGSIEPR